MLSSRRSAQLGLAAASLILISSIAVLVIGGSEDPTPAAAQARFSSVKHSIAGIEAQLPPPMRSDKQ